MSDVETQPCGDSYDFSANERCGMSVTQLREPVLRAPLACRLDGGLRRDSARRLLRPVGAPTGGDDRLYEPALRERLNLCTQGSAAVPCEAAPEPNPRTH